MTDIDKRLEEFRDRIEEYGKKRGLGAIADDFLKAKFAEILDEAPEGTVSDREAWVRRQDAHHDAITMKKNWIADWETIRLEKELLMAEIEKYRTDEATIRATHRMHQ